MGQIVTWLEGMKNWNLVAIKSTLNIGPLRQYFGMRSSCVRNMTTVWEDCENMTGNLCLCSSRLFCQSQQAFLPSVALSIQLPAFFGWNLVVLTWHLISGLHELSRTCHAYTQHPAPSTQHSTLGHLARALLEYSESTSDFPRVAPLLPPLQSLESSVPTYQTFTAQFLWA